MKMQPVTFRWKEVSVVRDGGEIVSARVMVPHRRFDNVCRRQYVDGEDYPLLPVEERSQASHNHYFAALKEAYDNLPEEWAKKFPNVENFRHWCLIETGWCTEVDVPFKTAADARKFAAVLREESPYAVMTISGATLKIIRAVSQSRHAMKKDAFERSSKEVLELAASMIGVRRTELQRQADKVVPRNVVVREGNSR